MSRCTAAIKAPAGAKTSPVFHRAAVGIELIEICTNDVCPDGRREDDDAPLFRSGVVILEAHPCDAGRCVAVTGEHHNDGQTEIGQRLIGDRHRREVLGPLEQRDHDRSRSTFHSDTFDRE